MNNPNDLGPPHRDPRERMRGDGVDGTTTKSPIKPSDPVDSASDDSFPASDPPSFTPTHAGKPAKEQPPKRDKDDPEREGYGEPPPSSRR